MYPNPWKPGCNIIGQKRFWRWNEVKVIEMKRLSWVIWGRGLNTITRVPTGERQRDVTQTERWRPCDQRGRDRVMWAQPRNISGHQTLQEGA